MNKKQKKTEFFAKVAYSSVEGFGAFMLCTLPRVPDLYEWVGVVAGCFVAVFSFALMRGVLVEYS